MVVGVTVAPGILSVRPNRALAAIGILEVSSWILFAEASTIGLLPVVGLLASLYPVVTVVLARIVLDERVSPTQLAGIALVMIGLFLIALS